MTSSARDNAITVGILLSSICSVILFIGIILAASGALTTTATNGDFVSHRAVPCTVITKKIVENTAGLGGSYVAIASVRLDNDSVDFAAIRQFESNRRAYSGNAEDAFARLAVTDGERTTCGVPADGQPPTRFSSVDQWPVPRPAAVDFDRAMSQAELDYKANLILAGSVFLGVGGGTILVFLAMLLLFRCCDKCGDCDCSCGYCVDSYEQYMLERRINSSGGGKQQQQQQNGADFTEDGLLTHYTCHYGAGACCTLFLAQLCGSSRSSSSSSKPLEPPPKE